MYFPDTHQPMFATHAEKVAWMEAVVQDVVNELPRQASVGTKRHYLMAVVNGLAAHADVSPTTHLVHRATALTLRYRFHGEEV